ncbi:hypothetical protein F9B70_09695 [Staphylococcus epidermidis]|nr:hypothetical protein F9B70_09695 [Staphylococcus epidermidis]
MKKTLFIITAMIFGIVYFDKYRFLLKKYETDIIDVE